MKTNEALEAEERYKSNVEKAAEYVEFFDILETINNVGNDEVFTPRKVVDMMLDSLPDEVWHNPHYRWLNPATKTGIFEREIAIRLDEGLKDEIPDTEARRKHILQDMIFSIGQTKFTANVARRTLYYCCQANRSCDGIKEDGHYVNGYAIGNGTWFDDPEGNIKTPCSDHVMKKGKCIFCGITEGSKYLDANQREKYSYDFIHCSSGYELQAYLSDRFFKGDKSVKFDVIIGNPPYHLSDGGGGQGTSATPIYQKFVNQALSLKPKYASFIIPARWMVKGKGPELKSFKETFLNQRHVMEFHQYIQSTDCFPNDIPGGVCFFLWNRDYDGKCQFSLHDSKGNVNTSCRYLNEGNVDIILNDPIQTSIINKVLNYMLENGINPVSEYVSPRNPFNLSADVLKKPELYSKLPSFSETEFQNSIRILGTDTSSKRVFRYISNSYVVTKGHEYVGKYKIFAGKATVGGQTLGEAEGILVLSQPVLADLGDICTDSYEVLGPFETRQQCINFVNYMRTKFFRYLLACRLGSQNISRKSYAFVPFLSLEQQYCDIELYDIFSLSEEERNRIDMSVGEVSWVFDA